jgi:hypothetical protein
MSMQHLTSTSVIGLINLFLVVGAGCTRANPDLWLDGSPDLAATGGSPLPGQTPPAEDLATSPGDDLRAPAPDDMLTTPPDLLPPRGVLCGNQTCDGAEPSCCFDKTPTCVPAAQMCNDGPYACDGPEDCGFGNECCFNDRNVFSGCAVVGTCNGIPMCHVVSDCPPTAPFVACCPDRAHPEYRLCSRSPCQ